VPGSQLRLQSLHTVQQLPLEGVVSLLRLLCLQPVQPVHLVGVACGAFGSHNQAFFSDDRGLELVEGLLSYHTQCLGLLEGRVDDGFSQVSD
jgi:hypothetical protein